MSRDVSVPRKLCNHCACENVACGRRICLRFPLIAGEFKKFLANEMASLNKKKIINVQSRMRFGVDEDESVGRDRFPCD